MWSAEGGITMKNKYPWVISIIAILLVLDQFTKYLVVKYMSLYQVVTVIPGFFNLTSVRNRGAAFGVLANVPGVWRSVFFITVTFIAIGVIVVLIKKTHERLPVIAFALIAGGALGNVIDRIRYGEVVDFIQWYVKSYSWPSFNVADSAISVGVALLAIDMLFMKKTEAESTES